MIQEIRERKQINLTDQRLTSNTYPPHTNLVIVMKAALPADAFEPIAQVKAGKAWYRSTDNVQQALADRARELGADAVIEHGELACSVYLRTGEPQWARLEDTLAHYGCSDG